MPKKIENTVEYFPMYSVPSNTCIMLKKKYGNDGYAFYYQLLQLLGKEDNHYYDARDPFDLETLHELIGPENPELHVSDLLNDLAKWGKIDRFLWDNKVIWYQGFVDTLEPVYRKRERASKNTRMPNILKIYDLTGLNPNSDILSPDATGIDQIRQNILSHPVAACDNKDDLCCDSMEQHATATSKTSLSCDSNDKKESFLSQPVAAGRQSKVKESKEKKAVAKKKKTNSAAAFFGNSGQLDVDYTISVLKDKEIPEEVLDNVIEQIAFIRSKKTGLGSLRALKQTLHQAYVEDETELDDWLSQLKNISDNQKAKQKRDIEEKEATERNEKMLDYERQQMLNAPIKPEYENIMKNFQKDKSGL